MANRNFSKVKGLNKEIVIIAGRFDDADAKVQGLGYTAANTGTGIYTITLDDKYPALLACTATAESTSDFNVNVASSDVTSAKTIVLHVKVGGVLTDLTSGDEIHFAAILSNTTIRSV